MAAKVILNPFDLLTHDEQTTLNTLFDVPKTGTEPVKAKHGWFVRSLPDAFVNSINAVPMQATEVVPSRNNCLSPKDVKRENIRGNFCGHNPVAPRFIMQNHAYFAAQKIDDLGVKRRPQILYDIVERIKAYYNNPDVIPSLQTANADKRHSKRQRRSESREAVINLLTIMVMNMDLSSLRIGQPTADGGFFNYGLEWLAKKAKLSFSRAKRAMSDLNNAMLIASYQYRELVDQETQQYIAHNAVRVFDLDFFQMLKIDEQKFCKARKVSYEKQKHQQATHQSTLSKKDAAVTSLMMKKIMQGLNPRRKKCRVAHLAQNEDEQHKINRLHKKRTQLVIKLRENPDYQNNEAAFEDALRQGLAALNLLHPHEKQSNQ